MNTIEVTVKPISPFGAEVGGVDLKQPLPEEVKQRLREAWDKYALLVFRDQDLTKEEQVRVGEIFGPVSEQGISPGGFNFVTNLVKRGLSPQGEMNLYSTGELRFHFDNSFYDEPVRGVMLYGIEVPPPGNGGETLFSDVRKALDLLPDDFRNRIASIKARYRLPTDQNRESYYDKPPMAEHLLIEKHRFTGDDLLFFSRRHAVCLLGFEDAEGEKLMDEIASYIERPEVVYSHEWKPKDLVLWDNLAVQHARNDYDASFRRHLRRLQFS